MLPRSGSSAQDAHDAHLALCRPRNWLNAPCRAPREIRTRALGAARASRCGERRSDFEDESEVGCSFTVPEARRSNWKGDEIMRIGGHTPKMSTGKTGTHADRKHEQQRLGNEHGLPVSGSTHESEHAVGNNVLVDGQKRGSTKENREIEKNAMAYQEVKEDHRGHVGTGTGNTSKARDPAAFGGADGYRRAQDQSIRSGSVSSAVQLGQLGYAHMDGFQSKKRGIDQVRQQQSNDSFDQMVEHKKSLDYLDGGTKKKVRISPEEQAEMYLSRRAAQTGRWPTVDEINQAMKKFGVD